MRTPHISSGKITAASPLMVLVDGNTAAVPAASLNGAVYAGDERVSVLIRNGNKPLVLGTES